MIFHSLHSQQLTLKEDYTSSSVIKIAIDDFVQSEKISKKDTVYHVEIVDVDENIIGVSIIGADNKWVPSTINVIGSSYSNFPTEYYIINSKLFSWYDSTKYVSEKLIYALADYHQIDSMNVNGFIGLPEQIIDDSKKGADYYFCRNNIYKFKKVITNRAIGYYKPPRINCK